MHAALSMLRCARGNPTSLSALWANQPTLTVCVQDNRDPQVPQQAPQRAALVPKPAKQSQPKLLPGSKREAAVLLQKSLRIAADKLTAPAATEQRTAPAKRSEPFGQLPLHAAIAPQAVSPGRPISSNALVMCVDFHHQPPPPSGLRYMRALPTQSPSTPPRPTGRSRSWGAGRVGLRRHVRA